MIVFTLTSGPKIMHTVQSRCLFPDRTQREKKVKTTESLFHQWSGIEILKGALPLSVFFEDYKATHIQNS